MTDPATTPEPTPQPGPGPVGAPDSDAVAAASRAGAPPVSAQVAAMRALNPNSLMDRMGIEIVEASVARLVATMPVEGNTQPQGLLHGGASVVLAETLGSIGAQLHAGPGTAVVGLDINATHHRSGRTGVVTATASPLSLGRTLACYEVVVTDDAGRRLCTSRITCLIRPAGPDS
jgi:1,4-dihydroxy-2-naphthoyl-CoA hydrolase